ncbi:MAG TPA: glycosyl transferase [Cytophagaceae bacterium]|jgi:hypothetical protein
MKTAFTICSLNYLSQALTLGDSLARSNPDWKYIIGLVDRVEGQLASENIPYEILEIKDVGIESLESMVINYNIIELNTAVKPFIIDYLFRNTATDYIIYFDPDIYVYSSIDEITTQLQTYDITVTPHITTPITQETFPKESHFLNYGLYNLGFIALRRSKNTDIFIEWWKERLETQCFINEPAGLFVDQLWVNLAPIFFDNILIDKTLGHNMAYWNLHERFLTKNDGQYNLQTGEKLKFYHFSACNPNTPTMIAKYTTKTFEERPDLVDLYNDYFQLLLKNKFNEYKKIECYYVKYRSEYWKKKNKKTLFQKIKGRIARL